MYLRIYVHIHTCAHTVQRVLQCRRWVRWCQRNICASVTSTPANVLVPRSPIPKCMQHSLQKIAHIYIHTHICIRIHMHTNTHAHPRHRPHAEAPQLRPAIYAQICIFYLGFFLVFLWVYLRVYVCACLATHFLHGDKNKTHVCRPMMKYQKLPKKMSFFNKLRSKAANYSRTLRKLSSLFTNLLYRSRLSLSTRAMNMHMAKEQDEHDRFRHGGWTRAMHLFRHPICSITRVALWGGYGQ